MSIGERLLREVGPIRVINLPHRKDRRVEVEAELAKLGLGTDHAAISFFPAFRPDDAGSFPTIGTRGCYLSHLGVLKAALVDGAESVLILEDDASFTKAAVARLPAILDRLGDTNWSIFYGGFRPEEGDMAPEAEGVVPFAAETNIVTAHFVAFRQPAIERAVAFLEAMLARPAGSPEGGPMHVDGAYSWFRRANPDLVTMVAIPEVAHQRASRTDIHDLNLVDRLPLVRDVMQGLRRLRRQR